MDPNVISIPSGLDAAYERTDRGMISLDVLQMRKWLSVSIPDGRELIVMKRGDGKAAVRIIGEKHNEDQ
jgi:hypothetical protein